MFDAWKNFAQLVGNEDQGRVIEGDLFKVFKKLALCAEVKSGCRFVEHQSFWAMNDRACQ